MVYTFVIIIVYLNLNFIFNIWNVITTKYRFLATKNTEFWKLSLVIFLSFWPFEPHFLINFFHKENVQMSSEVNEGIINCAEELWLKLNEAGGWDNGNTESKVRRK